MVFQDQGLWPHLSARKHVEYVLSGARRRRRCEAEALLDECQLPESTWDRLPSQTSGGEAQRLAIARALATRPRLLLLDEPLSHLDSHLRGELLQLLDTLIRGRVLTTVYVTHSWTEATSICDRVAVLDAGGIIQEGSAAEIFRAPANHMVARLSGRVNELPPWVFAKGLIEADPTSVGLAVGRENADAILCRPTDLELTASNGEHPWRVIKASPQDAGWLLTLSLENVRLLVATLQPVACGESFSVRCKAALQPANRNGCPSFVDRIS